MASPREIVYSIPALPLALASLGVVAIAALLLSFALARHLRLPVRAAAGIAFLASLVGLGATVVRPMCYKPALPPPGPTSPAAPQERLEALAALVARGAVPKAVAEKAARLR